jgi:hypothetical protein
LELPGLEYPAQNMALSQHLIYYLFLRVLRTD